MQPDGHVFQKGSISNQIWNRKWISLIFIIDTIATVRQVLRILSKLFPIEFLRKHSYIGFSNYQFSSFFRKLSWNAHFTQRFKQIEPNGLLPPEFYVSRLLKIDCLGHGHLIWNRSHTFARFVNFLFAQSESHYQHFGWAIFSWFRKSIVRWFLYLHLGIEPRDRKWSSGRISR